LVLEQNDAARLCVDRALASIASMDNAESSLLEVSVWLFDAIEDLLLLGDTERAIGLSLTNARNGQNIFPVNSFEYFRLLRTAASAYEAAGMIPQAKDAIERALVVLTHIHMDSRIQAVIASDAETFAALICVLGSDLPGARRHLAEHPLHAAIAEIRARGVLQTFPEISFVAVRALVNAVPGGGGEAGGDDLPLLTKPIELKYPLPVELAARATMYQRIGHAIAVRAKDMDRSDAELRALAGEVLRLETKRADAVGFLPRRGLVDQLVLSLVVNAYRNVQLDPGSGDTLVRLIDLATRNGQSYSSEALGLVASARDDEVRTDIRDLLRLRSRRDATERIDIARVVSTKRSITPDGKVIQPVIEFKRRGIYGDYGKLIQQISTRIANDQPELLTAHEPPTLDLIQSSLRGDEVVVAAPLLLGNVMGHLCITKDSIRFATTTEDLTSLSRDIRLLEASLTSQNEPSAELDHQYPVAAARRVYDTLLAPAEPCLAAGDSIDWVGPGPDTVPLAALLTRGTAEELQRRPLARWPWVATEYPTSQVTALSTLVALRRKPEVLSTERKPEFLGIGDPLFSGTPDAESAAAKFAMRGAVGTGGLAALPQLPETRAEIANTAALFVGRETELLGGQATEGDIRRLPLERFTYIEFATHGLVRQDISGLTEPALALTPTSANSFDDGLLTASEIADLPLKARFVALSACNTGLLDFTKFASEVSGLSAAFQVAGVPATLATLWPVESEASKEIVEETFRRLIADRVSPVTALALSQRNYLANPPSVAHEHPRFWAPFVIFGDGAVPSEGLGSRKSAQIGGVRLLTSSGGEVSSMILGKSDEWLLRGMGDVKLIHRHSGMTMGMREDLTEVWKKEDPLLANSPAAVRVDGGFLLGGFRGGGVIPTVGTIQFMGDAGEIKQEWELARPSDDTSPVRALRIGPQAALVAFVIHTRKADANQPWPLDRIALAEISLGHPMRIRAEFQTISRFNPSFVGLEFLGNDILVAVASPIGDGLPRAHIDDFHQMVSCGLEIHSSLTLLKAGTFANIWEKPLPGIQLVGSLRGHHGSIRLVGSLRAACGEGTRITLWEINQQRILSNLYTDKNPRDSQALGSLEMPDKSLVLIGKSNRTTDVDSFEERDPQNMLYKNTSDWVSFSTRRIDDAVIIYLDNSLNERSRETLRAGSDLWLNGGVSTDSGIWLYGALGNQAALIQVVHE